MSRSVPPLGRFRASLFWLLFILCTLVIGLVMNILGWFLPMKPRYALARSWSTVTIHILRLVCGVRWHVEGRENLPADGEARIYFAKHQSTWETLALVMLLPPHVHVLKRELLRIPLVGWGLKMVGSIAIDRAAGRKAVQQMLEQGRERLANGRSVMIFPEGTRVKSGATARYKMGGAILAADTGMPVIPIAHNAGQLWPRHSYIKWPGVITVVIGQEIPTTGKDPDRINREAQEWIENTMARLEPNERC